MRAPSLDMSSAAEYPNPAAHDLIPGGAHGIAGQRGHKPRGSFDKHRAYDPELADWELSGPERARRATQTPAPMAAATGHDTTPNAARAPRPP